MTVDRSIGLVLDCRDPEGLARFWSAALGYESVRGSMPLPRMRTKATHRSAP